MATLAACRAWLEAQVGTVEHGGPDGHSGNLIHYWEDIGHHEDEGLSWCGALQDAMAKATGLELPGSMIDTTEGALAFQRAGLWVPVSHGGQPGDFPFYAWSGKKTFEAIDHIGWLVTRLNRSSLQDIEGNTSGVGDSGEAQRNGGMVAKRTRSTKFVVGYGRPHYDPPTAPTEVLSSNPWNFHTHLVQASQWALGRPVTGKWDKATLAALIAFKTKQGLPGDSGIGPKTMSILAQVRHHRQV